jgi:4-hydroxy 2-oxovalerate aldolase
MQLAYSNAQSLVDMNTEFRIIIDTTIYGMGRGAGNLNTELFIQYLNENMDRKYDIKPLLRVIDEILDTFYQRNYWGYSLPNFISATYNTHPNYAGYLSNKNALTVENIEEIFAMMSDEKRLEFDKEYIEALYLRYMEKGNTNQTHYEELKKKLDGKRVLIIAPGKSIKDEHEAVESAISASDTISIAINAKYTAYETDYIFVSNIRRFKNIPKEEYAKCIITSNISSDGGYIQTEYRSLLNNVELVRDNAGLMLINFLKQIGVKEVLLAGMDGYSHDADENYAESQMMLVSQAAVLDAMNAGMTEVLESFSKDMKITFITTRRYVGDGI